MSDRKTPRANIGDHTRKLLWMKGGDRCAFTGCDVPLHHRGEDGSAETVIGIECHIVAKADDQRVARAPSSLSAEERARWSRLVEHRHELANLVLMCSNHARQIDDPAQGFTVEDIVAMKEAHEAEVAFRHRTPLADLPQGPRPLLVLLEDVPAWQRLATKALAEADPTALTWLREQIGDPAEGAKLTKLVRAWPAELDGGSDQLLNLLVREAEALGLWPIATDIWERLAARVEGGLRADRLARAAVDAGVGGEAQRRERLLGAAEELDPNCVRVRLERFDDRVDPVVQLEFLQGLETEDPKLVGLIASQACLACLLLGDLDGAETWMGRAQEADPDSIAVGICRVNLEVQRGRLALVADRAFVTAHLLDARDRALGLRERLLAMGRWEESVRLLMMAADVPGLLRDQDAARELLEQARPEEIEARDGASVLGDAALRAGAPQLALRFVEGRDGDEGLVRIAAVARAEIPGPQRPEAFRELERLALAGGMEAELAAIARLMLCLPPVLADWDEEVARSAESGEHSRLVESLRVMVLSRSDPAGALELAQALPREAWAAEVRLRVAGSAEDHEAMRSAAEEFLAFGPDSTGRLLASQALAQAGEIQRASEITASITEDPNAPPRVRNDAFHVRMKTLADLDRWPEAATVWENWASLSFRELRPADDRISAWQVRVASNRRRLAGGRM